MPIEQVTANGNPSKIDNVATEGLDGTENSLAYRVGEIERHLHGRGYWFGKDPGDTFLLEDGLTAWQLTAGSGEAYGDWVQLSDGDEITAGEYWDPHLIHVKAASAASKLYYVQFGTGESGSQVVTGMVSFLPAATLRQASETVQSARIAVTSKVWARCKCETNAATIDFVVGGHVYEG